MNITNYIVEKLNGYGTTEFRSNYVFDFRPDMKNGLQFSVLKVNQQSLEMDKVEFVPVSEIVNSPTPFVEKNDRTGWVKTIAFPLRIKNGFMFDEQDDAYQALISLYQELNGLYDTIDGKKVSFKVTPPRYDQKAMSNGEWYAIMVIDFFMTTLGQGFFCTEYDVFIKRQTDEEYHELDYIEFSTPTGSDEEIVPDVRDNNTAKLIQSRYALQLTISFNYLGGELERELYSYQMGKGDPKKKFNLRAVHESGTYDYVVSISNGTPLWKRGTVDRVSIDMKEVG
jgi:hypothetical protein